MAERAFATKLHNVGFVDVDVIERRPFGVKEAADYPLFTADLLDLMRELIPPERHDQIATVLTLTARRPEDQGRRGSSSSGG